MTVSASIPVAVLSITLFRVFSRVFGIRKATILENNIVQTAGSAGESIAFGVGVTMPALMILGFEMDIGRVIVVSVLGGLLGILMMIPLRRAFIVKQHGKLKYPEGTACADVLIVGEEGGSSAKTVFVGFGVAFIFEFLRLGMKLWKEIAERPLSWYRGAVASIEVNPTLLGVGYIIGTRVSCIMVAGGVLTSFVLIPAIHMFGDPLGRMLADVPPQVAQGLPAKPLYPGDKFIAAMTEKDVRDSYTLYIGAGAVAAGGIISLVQALPLIVGSLAGGLRDVRAARASGRSADSAFHRTDRDLPLWIVFAGAVALVVAIWATTPLHKAFSWIPQLEMSPLGAILIVLFGFLFVTVSSRLTGEIGSSSNPISGMTVATLILTCLIFLALGWTSDVDRLAALSVAAVVCIASSNGGTTSQDLKTGYLVGSTPKYQQLAILVGTLTSSLVIGVILIQLNNASTVYSQRDLPQPAVPIDVTTLTQQEQAPGDTNSYYVWHAVEGNPQGVKPGKYLVDKGGKIRYVVDPGINGRLDHRDDGVDVLKYDAPKARLMALITDGILNQKLPWTLVLLGVSIAVVLELCGVPSLPFAVGVYLPLATSTPIFVGGLIRFVADRFGKRGGAEPRSETESDMSPGVLLSTGYIAGGAIAGMVVAFLSFGDTIPEWLGRWQYRQASVVEAPSLMEQVDRVAADELGLSTPTEVNSDADKGRNPGAIEIPRPSSPDTKTVEDKRRAKAIRARAYEIIDFNRAQLAQLAPVQAGTLLKLPSGETYRVARNDNLGTVAKEVLQSEAKAKLLLDLNESKVQPPDRLPPGTRLRLPQHTWPALAAFSILAALLLAVGLGWLFSGASAGNPPKRATGQADQDANAASRRPPGRRDDAR
jgi:uncharacterized oligopeptide transporter (OPT) family protein